MMTKKVLSGYRPREWHIDDLLGPSNIEDEGQEDEQKWGKEKMKEWKNDYRIGDEVWIFISGHKGDRTRGRVVAFLDLPGWNHRNYVIEIDTHIDPLLEVRSAFTMRDCP